MVAFMEPQRIDANRLNRKIFFLIVALILLRIVFWLMGGKVPP